MNFKFHPKTVTGICKYCEQPFTREIRSGNYHKINTCGKEESEKAKKAAASKKCGERRKLKRRVNG